MQMMQRHRELGRWEGVTLQMVMGKTGLGWAVLHLAGAGLRPWVGLGSAVGR